MNKINPMFCYINFNFCISLYIIILNILLKNNTKNFKK